jgi:hypothetical protein
LVVVPRNPFSANTPRAALSIISRRSSLESRRDFAINQFLPERMYITECPFRPERRNRITLAERAFGRRSPRFHRQRRLIDPGRRDNVCRGKCRHPHLGKNDRALADGLPILYIFNLLDISKCQTRCELLRDGTDRFDTEEIADPKTTGPTFDRRHFGCPDDGIICARHGKGRLLTPRQLPGRFLAISVPEQSINARPVRAIGKASRFVAAAAVLGGVVLGTAGRASGPVRGG